MSELNDLANKVGKDEGVKLFNSFKKSRNRLKVIIILIVATVGLVTAILLSRQFFRYEIVFNTMGGTPIDTITVDYKELSAEPTQKSKKVGYYIERWCVDKKCHYEYIFGNEVVGSLELYADWRPAKAILINYAANEGGEGYPTIEAVKWDYEEFVKPGTDSSLPIVINNIKGEHFGERLLFFETPDCSGEPLNGKRYTMDEDIEVYGKWFDMDSSKFRIEDGVLLDYYGNATNILVPNGVEKIRDVVDYNRGNDDGIGSSYLNQIVWRRVQGSVKAIYLNPELTYIGDNAFTECSSLTVVACLGNNVEHVGKDAFRASGVKQFTLSPNLTTVSKYSFRGSEQISSVIIPEGVRMIEEEAFYQSGLKSVVLPSTLVEIRRNAFSYCTHLTSVTLKSESVVNIVGVNAITDGIFFGTFSAVQTGSEGAQINDLKIYVPASLLSAYKNNAKWSVYKDCIYAIEVM